VSGIPWRGKAQGIIPGSPPAKKLDNLKRTYEEVQRTRKREAIFTYLDAVYREVRTLPVAKRLKVARYLHHLGECNVRDDTCLFSILVQLTTDADRRVRNRWIQALRKALEQGVKPDGFSKTVDAAGGLNAYNAGATKARASSRNRILAKLDNEDDW
jgi:hypothetical protein